MTLMGWCVVKPELIINLLVVYGHWRHISACTAVQCDQCLHCLVKEILDPRLYARPIRCPVTVHADLSRCWIHMSECTFFHVEAQIIYSFTLSSVVSCYLSPWDSLKYFEISVPRHIRFFLAKECAQYWLTA